MCDFTCWLKTHLKKSAHSHISDMVAEQRGYTPWMGEEPNDRERGSPCNVVKDGVGVVKTIPREHPQRRMVERKTDGLVSQFQEQTDEVIKVTFSERVSGCLGTDRGSLRA